MAENPKVKKEKKSYFKDFRAELKKVIWPTPKQTVNSTTAVITIVLVTAVIVLCLDLVFELINTEGINKIKSAVTSSNNVENDTNVETELEEDSVEGAEDTDNADNTTEEDANIDDVNTEEIDANMVE